MIGHQKMQRGLCEFDFVELFFGVLPIAACYELSPMMESFG